MADLRNHSKTTLRVAIIGCGKIGSLWDEISSQAAQAKTHAGVFAKHADCEIVCFMDQSIERAKAAQVFWACGLATDSIDDVIQTKPDIICLCTPEQFRLSYLKALTKIEKLVIISEKPLAYNLSEAKEIAKIEAQQTQWKWLVNFIRRYSEAFQTIFELIESRQLGLPLSVQAQYGKGLRNGGSHALDLFSRVFQAYPTSVQSLSLLPDDLVDSDPSLELRLEYAGQDGKLIPAHLLPCDHRLFTIFEMKFFFSKGRIDITDLGHNISVYEVIADLRYPDYRTLIKTSQNETGLKNFFENMALEAVALYRGDQLKSKSTFKNAFQHVKVIEDAIKSLNQNSQKIIINYNS